MYLVLNVSRDYLLSFNEGSCDVSATKKHCCVFFASDVIDLQSFHVLHLYIAKIRVYSRIFFIEI